MDPKALITAGTLVAAPTHRSADGVGQLEGWNGIGIVGPDGLRQFPCLEPETTASDTGLGPGAMAFNRIEPGRMT